MHSNALVKQNYEVEAEVVRPKPALTLIEKKLEAEVKAESLDVDYEAFLSQYGKGSDFA
jgi:hypothetical protein